MTPRQILTMQESEMRKVRHQPDFFWFFEIPTTKSREVQTYLT